MENILLSILGLFIGNGIRIMYHVLTGKDIPIYKYPYVIQTNGTIEKYYSANKPLGSDVKEPAQVSYRSFAWR